MDKIISKIVKELSELEFVEAVILFGSRARGSERKDSDFDIAVITKNSNGDEENLLFSFGSEKVDISVFSRLPLAMQFRVLKEGKVLFVRDESFLRDLRVKNYRFYLDYSSFINNFYRRIIQNV